ncbi:MAG: tRNA (adenosine(37)-N6)-threonylcarbamoyltransferase complex ATPase subunit type 1 TsaE [Spirochaetaceae bacterium]|jgi:tRNA threonylcarbamoyladenosine biosynthesis protein TsaE|nr:tRNA (adenosine(37)-N6)-threonylcarbamoyltransferase complex ATPase subunit type 1 TsaE [Spirochaetaceae bacterium]
MEYITNSAEETAALGETIGKKLKAGDIVVLNGTLGSGKTCFTRGLARGAGVTEPVTSPTYAIVNEYAGIVPFYHIDAYRLASNDDFESIGGTEIISSNSICVVEWGSRIEIPPYALHVEICFLENDKRKIIIEKTEK